MHLVESSTLLYKWIIKNWAEFWFQTENWVKYEAGGAFSGAAIKFTIFNEIETFVKSIKNDYFLVSVTMPVLKNESVWISRYHSALSQCLSI